MKYNYSIIIPHKNAPKLLQRCIGSIPQRDDVQIVVVDDNGDKDVVDWKMFLLNNNNKIELVITTEGKGAGYARNVGLSHAKGRWILFADCDDYYCDGFLDVLDKYKCQNLDVVYFSYLTVDFQGNKKPNLIIDKAIKESTQEIVDAIKYRQRVPWNKMISRSFIDAYNVHFEQCINGNDLFFSYQVGFYSHSVVLEPTPLYCYVHNTGSLTHKKKNSDAFYACILGHRLKSNRFYNYIGYSKWEKPLYKVFVSFLYKRGFIAFFQSLNVYIQNYKQFKKSKNEFVDFFENTKHSK